MVRGSSPRRPTSICNDLLQIQSLLLNNCCNNVALTGKLLLTFQSSFIQNFPLVKTWNIKHWSVLIRLLSMINCNIIWVPLVKILIYLYIYLNNLIIHPSITKFYFILLSIRPSDRFLIVVFPITCHIPVKDRKCKQEKVESSRGIMKISKRLIGSPLFGLGEPNICIHLVCFTRIVVVVVCGIRTFKY